MIVLWAMSLWVASLILCVTGFGQNELAKLGINPHAFVALGFVVWVLGWVPGWTQGSFWRVNWGFVTLAVLAWVMVGLTREGRWWAFAVFLSLAATLARMVAPLSSHQASVLPGAAIESVGLGISAGLTVGQGAPAAIVSACAESASAFLISLRHQHHIVGRHDLALVIVAGLSAWATGWIASWIVTWGRRPA